MRVVVLSTFDVWPPRDGGQTRYNGLWSSFPDRHDVKIIAYDFRNLQGSRQYRLSANLEVIVPAALQRDAEYFYSYMGQTGLWLHDAFCLNDYVFSDEFLQSLRDVVSGCDVIVASHPYLARVAFPLAPPNVLKVYESHNVEFDVKRRYFSTSKNGNLLTRLLDEVFWGEEWASRQARLVTAVSESDRLRLIELYSLSPENVVVIPNGAFVRGDDILGPDAKASMRQKLGLQANEPVAVFLGSSYEANVSSYRKARAALQDCGFEGTVLIIGSIADVDRSSWSAVSFNEIWFGFVDQELRDALLATSDFAIQLIYDGAGTNLKLFDYMSLGVPIIANAFGRRGVDGVDWCWEAESRQELKDAIRAVRERGPEIHLRTRAARDLARAQFDWGSIAGRLEAEISLRR